MKNKVTAIVQDAKNAVRGNKIDLKMAGTWFQVFTTEVLKQAMKRGYPTNYPKELIGREMEVEI